MSTSTLGLFLRHLALSAEVSRLDDASDHDLLAAYEPGRGQAAFTELMRRHGPMVLRTCRRVLGQEADAEDAFQATFLFLARQAGSIGKREALSGWLHRVAYRTALKILTGKVRRRVRERQASAMTQPAPDPAVKATWNEIQPILDAELEALPEQSRRLLIACYLEDKTHAEAAAELGLPRGSVAWRLEQARAILADRLARRGITVSAALLAVLLQETAKGAGIPAVLLVHTVEAARTFTGQTAGVVSDSVARLVKGGLARMTKGWTYLSMALAGWVGLLGVGLIACQTLKAWPDQTPEGEPPAAAAQRPAREGDKAARTDCFGDPLPPGALARMGTVRLWHNGYADGNGVVVDVALAFSPDGKTLASHCSGDPVRLWDVTTGKEISRLTITTSGGRTALLGFSPDGKTLATTHDRMVCLWKVATGKLLHKQRYQGVERQDAYPVSITFLPNGKVLAVGSFKDTHNHGWGMHLWDVDTGKEIHRLGGPMANPISRVAFSPDGKMLANVTKYTREAIIHLWEIATGKEICQLKRGKKKDPTQDETVAFSSDGKMLALGVGGTGDSAGICVWEVATGKPILLSDTGGEQPCPFAYSPDGKTLVWGSGHLWDAVTGKEIRRFGWEDNPRQVVFSPDGKILATRDSIGVIRLWEVATGKETLPHQGHQNRINSIAYSPDGKTLASASNDETTRLWEVATGKEIRHSMSKSNLKMFRGNCLFGVSFSPDGKTLASMDGLGAYLWETATGKQIHEVEGGMLPCSAVFSPDGKILAAGNGELDPMSGKPVVPVVRLWKVATGKEIYTLPTERRGWSSFWKVAFSPDGRILAIPGKENTVCLWEVATGKPIGQFGGQKQPKPQDDSFVRSLAFSPDYKMLAAACEDNTVLLWDMASGKEIYWLNELKKVHKPDEVRRPNRDSLSWSLAFSPDGRMLAAGGGGGGGGRGKICLWDVATGKEIGQLVGHRSSVSSVAFSPDGKTLASGSGDLTCLVWDVAAVVGRLKPVAAGILPPKSLSKEQLEAAWADLASTDAAKAYQAVSTLRVASRQAIPLLKERVRPAAPVADPKQLARWIADLDNESFAVREKTQRAIESLGEPAIPALRQALADQPPLEMKRRLQNILAAVEPKLVTGSTPEQLRQMRAVQVLESIGTAEARRLLQALAKGVAEARLTVEAESALARLCKRPAAGP